MVSKVEVTYDLCVVTCSLSKFTERFFKLSLNYGVDCDIHLTRTSITASVYPFRYEGAKTISEKDGADFLHSLIYLFENCFENAHLWSVNMTNDLPF